MSTLRDVHTVWDNSIAPLAEVVSGETVEFEVTDAPGGQLDRDSGVEAVAAPARSHRTTASHGSCSAGWSSAA
jgi:acetamidase/formamidase